MPSCRDWEIRGTRVARAGCLRDDDAFNVRSLSAEIIGAFFMAMTIHRESILISMRLWSLRAGELAVELARQSHEEASRAAMSIDS